jgi:hypothetical protein
MQNPILVVGLICTVAVLAHVVECVKRFGWPTTHIARRFPRGEIPFIIEINVGGFGTSDEIGGDVLAEKIVCCHTHSIDHAMVEVKGFYINLTWI